MLRAFAGWLAVLLLAIAAPAHAQDYPNRTITMLVPFPPGGGNDTLARIVAGKLTDALGQQVVVDNRPGANGVIAMRAAARAAPDGYTIVFANTSSTTINLALNPAAGYDTHKEFAPIGMFASAGIGIIANPAFPANNVAELIAFAKREPGKLSIGTSPPGSGSHLSAEMFKARAGVEVTYVPYKGAAALNNDLLGNHIPVVFSVLPASLGAIRAGKLKVLAATGTARIPLLPEVPTVAETLPGFEAVIRYGLLAPAGTPAPVIARLNKELRALAASPEVKERIASEAGNAMTSSPENTRPKSHARMQCGGRWCGGSTSKWSETPAANGGQQKTSPKGQQGGSWAMLGKGNAACAAALLLACGGTQPRPRHTHRCWTRRIAARWCATRRRSPRTRCARRSRSRSPAATCATPMSCGCASSRNPSRSAAPARCAARVSSCKARGRTRPASTAPSTAACSCGGAPD